MPYLNSHTERPDRGRAADARRLGPYETAYDVRRGYDLPPRPRERSEDVLLFRGREEERPGEGG